MNRTDEYTDGYLDGYRKALSDARHAAFSQSSNLPGPWLRAVDVLITRLENVHRRAWLGHMSRTKGTA